MPQMTVDDFDRFLAETFPQALEFGARVEQVTDRSVRVRKPIGELDLRPGGTVSGPVLMTLADTAFYFAVLAAIGPVALAVTTNLNINFLRRPPVVDLIADAELLKLGRRLAVGSVAIYSEGIDEPVAHATLTYSIPPPDRR
jgi:uncharacterized protein (TIGR00369 family)